MQRADLLRAAGALSLLAGLLHVIAAGEHLDEWWGYGLFFLFASLAQLYYGLPFLAVLAPNPQAAGARPQGGNEGFFLFGLSRRQWFLAGIAGNLAVILLYVVSRTVGVPAGPEAGEVEPLTALGLASKATELALVVALMGLVRTPAAQAQTA